MDRPEYQRIRRLYGKRPKDGRRICIDEFAHPAYALEKEDLVYGGTWEDWKLPNEVAFYFFPVDANGMLSYSDRMPLNAKAVRRIWHESLHCYSYTIDPIESNEKREDENREEQPIAWYAYDWAKPEIP